MMSRNLAKRLASLEAAQRGPSQVHCIRVYDGQTHDAARLAYEANNGPIGTDNGSDLHVYIRKPEAPPREAGSHAA